MPTVTRELPGEPSTPVVSTFTGEVWRDTVLTKTEGGVGIADVHFSPSARTYWHTHEGGQVLFVKAGEGVVADDAGVAIVCSGDTVWTAPGVRHWHGATAGRYMMHTSVSLGGTRWHEAVSESDYSKAVNDR